MVYLCNFTSSSIRKNSCLGLFNKEYTESALRTFIKYIIVQEIILDNNTLTYIDLPQPMGESKEK